MEEDPFATVECQPANCTLPYCFCSADGTAIPYGFDPKTVTIKKI